MRLANALVKCEVHIFRKTPVFFAHFHAHRARILKKVSKSSARRLTPVSQSVAAWSDSGEAHHILHCGPRDVIGPDAAYAFDNPDRQILRDTIDTAVAPLVSSPRPHSGNARRRVSAELQPHGRSPSLHPAPGDPDVRPAVDSSPCMLTAMQAELATRASRVPARRHMTPSPTSWARAS